MSTKKERDAAKLRAKAKNSSEINIDYDIEISDRFMTRVLSGNHQPFFYTENMSYLINQVQDIYDSIIEKTDYPKVRFPKFIRGVGGTYELSPHIISDLIGLVLSPDTAKILLKFNYDEKTGKYKNKAYVVRENEFNIDFFSDISLSKDLMLVNVDESDKSIEADNVKTREEVEELYLTVTKAKQMFSNNKFSKQNPVPLDTIQDKVDAYKYTETVQLILLQMSNAFEDRYPKKGSGTIVEGEDAMRLLKERFENR